MKMDKLRYTCPFEHEQRGNCMFSNQCHLFLVTIFHILQDKFYGLRYKLPKVKKVESDSPLRDFRKYSPFFIFL